MAKTDTTLTEEQLARGVAMGLIVSAGAGLMLELPEADFLYAARLAWRRQRGKLKKRKTPPERWTVEQLRAAQTAGKDGISAFRREYPDEWPEKSA